ncbi:MAG: ankyrin repeat domain-containing protein [Alphaproteobacteria bacterium]|nr:ankyrin repeat domain-containing protein [Alphaproteobacteria bacterium]
MRFIRVFLVALFFAPAAVHAASNDFMIAAQLLAAAKNADIQQVQVLINNGANVNYTDSTGLSIVCTALMNNDVRAAQILQMYGADASQCDRQIKQYNSRNKPNNSSGGLFSGLSSAQSITLTAAGAAVIVGGLFLLTDWLNPGNDNDSSSSSGGGSHGGGSGNTTVNPGDEAFKLQSGPATLASNYNYDDALDYYSPSDASSILYKNFAKMNGFAGGQNYMLMMHGYSPLARGYLGQRTLRNPNSNNPMPLVNTDGSYLYSFDGQSVQGGAPVNVAIVTPNGVNAAVDTSLGEYDEAINQYDFILFSTMNGVNVNSANNNMIFSKFYNNAIQLGGNATTLADDTISEDASRLTYFDLSGFGTAVHNPNATDMDNLLAKVVGGRDAGYSAADYFGFMPNGQMTIFRTGNGVGMVAPTTPLAGTYTTLDIGGVLDLNGLALTLDSVTDNTNVGGIKTFVAKDTSDNEYAGYIATNGYLYIDSNYDGSIDQAYEIDTDGLTLNLAYELGTIDYSNYDALINGAAMWVVGDVDNGRRSKPDILANVAVIDDLHLASAVTIDDILSVDSGYYTSEFTTQINNVYDNTDANTVGAKAVSFFNGLGSSYSPLVVFSTGAVETDSSFSGASKKATFENAAPLVFDNLEHLFMSVVAVGTTESTATQSKVSSYTPGGYSVMQWTDNSGASPKYYKARVCGVAGVGGANVDPWCFAAAGATDSLAVSSAAGAAGAVKSAFNYLSSEQLFVLLALTADGPLLATDSSGYAYTPVKLAQDLQLLYTLPNEYQFRVDNGEDYLSVFKEVFGYGMINLERATTPGKTVYYYDGTASNPDIVSGTSSAYWRAASKTAFSTSSALPMRAATITTSAYDVLESIDGSMSLPRIWESSFAIGNTSRHALYMGDVLGELKTRRDNANDMKIGNMSFHMARSDKAYNDNMNGLDELRLAFDTGAFHMSADYQRYLTDGEARFSGLSNPVLSLASNAITTNVQYDMGKWTFGTRAFSGTITNDGLLENDPTLSSQFTPATIGLINGVGSSLSWNSDKFGVTTSFGFAHETNTVLGAYTDGLIGLGAGDTQYVDGELRYSPAENVSFKLRGTYASTDTDNSGMFITDVSRIESNAFAFGADVGSFSFAIAQPLAAYNGNMKYAYANYAVVENGNGGYDIDVMSKGVEKLHFGSGNRELRLSGEYRHNFGEFTDGALGFIYRINPNNTNEFGNESIFMMKMSHRLGI